MKEFGPLKHSGRGATGVAKSKRDMEHKRQEIQDPSDYDAEGYRALLNPETVAELERRGK